VGVVTIKITVPLREKVDKPLLEVAINNLFFPKRKNECTYTSLTIK
jgi:hypothetical protein